MTRQMAALHNHGQEESVCSITGKSKPITAKGRCLALIGVKDVCCILFLKLALSRNTMTLCKNMLAI